ncbi:MAG: hypothetical protein IPG53_02410 [Ignavibacteriales bacterium]|nr:hypothetical protein [Ignavibacteriales bacterium]
MVKRTGIRKDERCCDLLPGRRSFNNQVLQCYRSEIYAFNDLAQFNGLMQRMPHVGLLIYFMTPPVERYVVAGDIRARFMLWIFQTGHFGGQGQVGGGFVEDLIVINDMNEDGVADVLVQALTPYIYVLSGKTGMMITAIPMSETTLVRVYLVT